jgi:hypothetical protein
MMLMKFNFHQKILTEMNDETEKSSIRIRKKKGTTSLQNIYPTLQGQLQVSGGHARSGFQA